MRTYTAKKPRALRNPERRMELAAALVHDKGKSRREAAVTLRCSEGTIRNDLARWAARQDSNVVHFPGPNHPRAGRNEPRKSAPERGSSTHPDYAVRQSTS